MISPYCHRISGICSALLRGGALCLIYSLFVLSSPVLAQASAGISPADMGSPADSVVRTISFSPADVQLQSRYRPTENDSLFPSTWWRRLYWGAGGGLQWLSDNAGSVRNTDVNLYLGYSFTPVHSIRLHGNLAFFRFGAPRKQSKAIGAGIDYMANLTNFAGGYSRKRLIDVSTIVGAGVRRNGGALQVKYAPYMHIGAHADLHLSSYFSVFVEPYVGVHRSMQALFERPNPEKWDLMYGANVGLQMSMDKRHDYFVQTDSLYRRFFLDSSLGIVVPGRSGGLTHRAGHGFQMAVGMWFNPMLGLRIGGQAQTSRAAFVPGNINGAAIHVAKNQALVGGRAELMVNPLNFLRSRRNAKGGHDLDFNLMLGGDYGWYTKADLPDGSDGAFSTNYYGVTGAVQALYRISNPGTYIFVEPRYLRAWYSTHGSATNEIGQSARHNFSLSVGTRLYMTGASYDDGRNDDFASRWWAGLEVGGVKWQRSQSTTAGGWGLNPAVGLSLGYDWTRYASFRAQMVYQRLYDTHTASYTGIGNDDRTYRGSGLWNSAHDLLDIRLAYMLNLNNLFQGYDSDRRFNLWLTAGPTFSCVANQSDTWVKDQQQSLPDMDMLRLNHSREGKASPGLAFSLMAALRVASRYELTGEALGQYNLMAGVNPGNKGRLNSIKYGFSLGTRYYFDEERLGRLLRGTDARTWQKGWELNASYGWALPLGTGLGTHAGGCNMAASLGYWFNSLLGARLGLVGQQTYYRSLEVEAVTDPADGGQVHAPYSVYHSHLMVGGRAELMLSPLNLLHSRQQAETAPRWDMTLSAGLNFGGMHQVGTFTGGYIGFTASAAALYRLSDQVQLYLEPRYDMYSHNRYSTALACNYALHDRMFTLSMGTRITRPVGESRESRRPSDPDHMSHRGLWLAAGIGGAKMVQSQRISADGPSIQPSASLSVGYDFSRLSSLRANMSYDRLTRQLPDQPYAAGPASGRERYYMGMVNNSFHMVDMRLLYMFNFTNLWMGTDRRNAMNVYLEAGPVFSTIMDQSNSLAKGEGMGLTDFRYLGTDHGGRYSFGLAAGILMALPVTDRWDITAEVLGQCYTNRAYLPKVSSRIYDDIKITFGLGTRYNF